jgi:enamine deaminase RidA (YjgF/YER057c/UK114 family)
VKVILHIGPHKSGTTSIQRFLHANAHVLREHGILYPEPWDGSFNHHCVAYALKAPDRWRQAAARIGAILDQAGASGIGTCVFSSEILVEDPVPFDEILEVFAGHAIHVVAYIRRPDHQWASAFAELVRQEGHRRSERIDEEPVPYDCGYSTVFPKWMSRFPPERMTIAPFDPSQWHRGRLAIDFLHTIGARASAIDACGSEDHIHNPSPPASLVEVLRRTNSTNMPSLVRQALGTSVDMLARRYADSLGPPPRLPTREAVRRAFDMLEPHLPAYRPYFRAGFDESFLQMRPDAHG